MDDRGVGLIVLAQHGDALASGAAYTSTFFMPESDMLDINPVAYQIIDLKGRVESLRGYL